jgi:hypothetical protein
MRFAISTYLLTSIVDIVAKYGFTNATEVLLAGGSAGALGLTSNIDWLNDVRGFI